MSTCKKYILNFDESTNFCSVLNLKVYLRETILLHNFGKINYEVYEAEICTENTSEHQYGSVNMM